MNLLQNQSWCFTGQFALLVAPVSQQPGVEQPMLAVTKKVVKGTWLRTNTAANLNLQVRGLTPLEQPSWGTPCSAGHLDCCIKGAGLCRQLLLYVYAKVASRIAACAGGRCQGVVARPLAGQADSLLLLPWRSLELQCSDTRGNRNGHLPAGCCSGGSWWPGGANGSN